MRRTAKDNENRDGCEQIKVGGGGAGLGPRDPDSEDIWQEPHYKARRSWEKDTSEEAIRVNCSV
jgi:hypothetical protein